jgi:hypothetical protein
MKITIHRDAISYGPYTLDQVRELVTQHRFARGDLACVEGEGKWRPLEELIVQESFRRQRANYIAEKNAAPKKGDGKKGRHANRWQWRPE